MSANLRVSPCQGETMDKPRAKGLFAVAMESVIYWSQSDASVHAAALAYFAVFSLAPLLIICIAIGSRWFSQAAVEGNIVTALQGLIGHEAAVVVEEIIKNTQTLSTSGLTTLITALFLLYSASSMFRQLQYSLNTMW